MSMRIAQPGIFAVSVMLCACNHSAGGSTSGPPATGLPSASEIAAIPMGHIAGLTDSAALARSIPNPYAGNAQAVAAGKALYIKMNCAGCHAYDAKGNMGPDLTDTYWRYGGLPAEIYQSIHDGRAQGMPAWGAALPPQEIWKLVAFIQSFGGSLPVNGTPRNAQRAELVAPELRAQEDEDDGAGFTAPAQVAPGTSAQSALVPPPKPGSPDPIPAAASSP
jgi:mono/diheme cytochrome c family protein